MTADEKQQIRADCKVMRQVEVACKWGITRQRVHQIFNEDPSALNQRPRPSKRTQGLIQFPGKHARFNDPELQAQVLAMPGTDAQTAARLGTTFYVIQRIRRALGARNGGRPRNLNPDEFAGA